MKADPWTHEGGVWLKPDLSCYSNDLSPISFQNKQSQRLLLLVVEFSSLKICCVYKIMRFLDSRVFPDMAFHSPEISFSNYPCDLW